MADINKVLMIGTVNIKPSRGMGEEVWIGVQTRYANGGSDDHVIKVPAGATADRCMAHLRDGCQCYVEGWLSGNAIVASHVHFLGGAA